MLGARQGSVEGEAGRTPPTFEGGEGEGGARGPLVRKYLFCFDTKYNSYKSSSYRPTILPRNETGVRLTHM